VVVVGWVVVVGLQLPADGNEAEAEESIVL
jgi:hypothetical protein